MEESKPAKKMPTWRPIVAAILLASGIGIVAVSFVWTHVSSERANWSTDQALKHQAAALKLHSLSHEYAHQSRQGGDQEIRDKLEQARIEYEALHGQLDAAIARPGNVALGLRMVGVALMSAGAYGLYRSRSEPVK
jgi:hypothetical protein